MILDLARLSSREEITGDESVVFRDVAGEENRIQCRIVVDVRKSGDTFYIRADVNGEFTTTCHKCLDATLYKVSPSFELVVQKVDSRSQPEQISAVDDYVRLPVGQNRLELDPYIYENLVVEVPMKITCSDDCKGLCSGCGANLNRETCRCDAAADPRWNELRKLKDSPSD